MMESEGYRIVAHTAEVGIEITGRTWAEFYRNALRGLLAVYAPEVPPELARTRRVSVAGESAEETLVAWINEAVYLVSAKGWLAADAEVREAGPRRIEAIVRGTPLSEGGRRVRLAVEVKSATYHDLRVRRGEGGLRALVILDI